MGPNARKNGRVSKVVISFQAYIFPVKRSIHGIEHCEQCEGYDLFVSRATGIAGESMVISPLCAYISVHLLRGCIASQIHYMHD
jgi:hypothetical protein